MTAILQPGDSVHLAMPYSPTGSASEDQKLILGISKEMSDQYAQQGVTVIYVSLNTALTAPVVVAVFRGPQPPPQES